MQNADDTASQLNNFHSSLFSMQVKLKMRTVFKVFAALASIIGGCGVIFNFLVCTRVRQKSSVLECCQHLHPQHFGRRLFILNSRDSSAISLQCTWRVAVWRSGMHCLWFSHHLLCAWFHDEPGWCCLRTVHYTLQTL